MRTVILLSILVLFLVPPTSAQTTNSAIASGSLLDSDGDGLTDTDETDIFGTDPQDPDTDNDSLTDGFEIYTLISDPLDADMDDDGLSDGEENMILGTDHLQFDTDGDQLGDGLESGRYMGIPNGISTGTGVPYLGTGPGFIPDQDPGSQTDPRVYDTDVDGLSDGMEDSNYNGAVDPYETDPNDPDTDSDSLPDNIEVLSLGTDPLSPDSDGDNIDDFTETNGGYPIDTDGDSLIDALDTDSDNDGILDLNEGAGDVDGDGRPNFRDLDSDGDGYDDNHPLEGEGDDDLDGIPNFLDPDTPVVDTDGDGIQDNAEIALGTDPTKSDSDLDGIGDWIETDGGLAVDTDSDGTIDALDTDSDDDAIDDLTEGVIDSDLDGIANYRDTDSDNDGIPDLVEGTDDVDGDLIGNYLDTDSDGDGYLDADENAAGSDPYDPAQTPDNLHEPAFLTISDVGNDQGRRVRISWLPSDYDVSGSAEPILSYSIFRRIDGNKSAGDGGFVGHAKAAGSWDFVLNLPAGGEPDYNTLAETLCDSTDIGICWSAFFVRAHTAVPTTFYDSDPDSGYSVDNLAPGAPVGFAVAYGPDNSLSWEPSEDGDFRYFRIYRGTTSGFIPGPEYLVHTTATTDWLDGAGSLNDHYLISAVDFSGNEGPASAPATVSGVEETPVAVFALQQNTPNPFNPKTTISFSLAQPEAVTLTVHDISGRLVRTLVSGQTRAAGSHDEVWNGSDNAGRQVAAGVYFYTVRTPSFTDTRRMTLVK